MNWSMIEWKTATLTLNLPIHDISSYIDQLRLYITDIKRRSEWHSTRERQLVDLPSESQWLRTGSSLVKSFIDRV